MQKFIENDNRGIILFTGENSPNFHTYSGALGHEFAIKYCGCIQSSEMRLLELKAGELVLVVIIWDFIEQQTGYDIVNTVREYSREHNREIPIIVIANENADESKVRLAQPDVFIREPHTPAKLREFVDIVHSVMVHQAVAA
ncbi:MAG TPA: hypothetical protein VL335_01165 [Candidatus Paceibacterota bacterium]|jgi:hypothetical protein|nr:hypothetical protein [Candidatus Paceibacterota bacterium]